MTQYSTAPLPPLVAEVDLVSGEGCTPLQRKLWEGLENTDVFRDQGKPRPQLRLAIRGTGRFKLDLNNPLVRPDDVEIVALFDTMVWNRGDRELVTNVLALKPRLTASGVMVTDSASLVGNLIPLPLRRYQPAVVLRVPGLRGGLTTDRVNNKLLSTRPGEQPYLIRRVGDYLDLCVGKLKDGRPAVLYRIALADVVGRRPRIVVHPYDELFVNGQCSLLSGETKEILDDEGKKMPVTSEDVLAEVQEPTDILKCLDNHRTSLPIYQEPRLPHMSTEHPVTVVAAELNHKLFPLVDELPAVSAWFAFSREAILGLANDPEFLATSQDLIDDLAASMCKGGLVYGDRVIHLQLTARHSGKIKQVNVTDGRVTLVYDGGHTQIAPPATTLRVKQGDVVIRGQALGDIGGQLESLTWDELCLLAGDALREVMTEFLMATSEPGINPPGSYLLPQRYVTGLEHRMLRDSDGRPTWMLDLSQLMNHLQPKINALVMPPVKLGETPYKWGCLDVYFKAPTDSQRKAMAKSPPKIVTGGSPPKEEPSEAEPAELEEPEESVEGEQETPAEEAAPAESLFEEVSVSMESEAEELTAPPDLEALYSPVTISGNFEIRGW